MYKAFVLIGYKRFFVSKNLCSFKNVAQKLMLALGSEHIV